MNPRPAHILVVEDDEAVRSLLGECLVFGGYRVETTADGEAALRVAATHRYDLCLVNLRMEGLQGDEVCRRLRRLPGYARVPLLITTGMLTPRLEERLATAGIDGILPKPLGLRNILALVHHHLTQATAPAQPTGSD